MNEACEKLKEWNKCRFQRRNQNVSRRLVDGTNAGADSGINLTVCSSNRHAPKVHLREEYMHRRGREWGSGGEAPGKIFRTAPLLNSGKWTNFLGNSRKRQY